MQQPTRLISTPFAQEGEKTEIQNVTGEFDNSATYRLGFPPLTMQSIRLGGKPPKGTDFNGVLFDITENISFLCKGGRYQYNAGLSTLIGGYPEGSNLLLDDNVTEVVSTVAGNQNNPNTNMAGWILKPNKTTAVNVTDASGETQQQVNYNGGSKWHSRVGGYLENERVVLDNGDIVQSTVDSNTNDPNSDMTGWAKTNSASQIFDEIGVSQQEINNTQEQKVQYVTIQMFSGANDHEKFLNAIASNRNILVTTGDYTINNNDITKMLTLKNGQFIHFEDGVRIFFDYNGFPLFNCVNSNGGGLTGFAEFVFTGASQTTSDFTMTQYKDACGVVNIIGGPHELHSVVMRVNCNNHKISDHFKFRSQTDSRDNGIIFCINDKGDGETQTTGNTIGCCTFENSIHGLLAASQKNFNYGNFFGNKRWSHPNIPPGHVVYIAGSPTNGWMDDGFVGDIYDLGETLDEDVVYNLAPLAPKGCRNVQFGTLTSHHFSGLYQSITNNSDCTFGKSIWRYNGINGDTSPHVNIAGGNNERIYLDIDADCPNVVFKFYEDTLAPLNNSTVKLKVRCKQQPATGSSTNIQMVRSASNGTSYDIDWTPSTGVGAFYVIPFEEITGIATTNKNTVNLKLRGANLVSSSTRVITRADTTVNISSEKPINRDITFQPYTGFAKRTFNTNVYKYNKAGVNTSGAWTETFQMPAEGMFILAMSAYAGGSGHSSAWLLNYTSAINIRAANQIGVSQETASPKVTLTSVTIDTVGLVTLTFSKTTADSSVLNVNLTKIGTLF